MTTAEELDDKVKRQNYIVAVLIVLMIGAGFLAVEERGKAASDEALNAVEGVQAAQCISGNASRLVLHANYVGDAAMYRELAGQEHDPEISSIYRRAAIRKEQAADSVLAAARQRGTLIDPNQPVIPCP